MNIPPTTKSQLKIISYQYKFRYLTINQLQQLFSHKDPRRIREWLNGLVTKKYLSRIKDPKDKTKPHVFCLAQRAGHILRKEADINENFLNWLYKEKSKSKAFIDHHLFIVDAYLYFLKNKKKGSKLYFFTKQDLIGYTYFPDPMPDAYIDVKEKDGNSRYFLDLFDETVPSGVLRYRARYYLEYAADGSWQANTDNAPFPTVLLVLPNERKKKHISFYAKAILEKSFNDEVEIFVTTKDSIKFAKDGINDWLKME